KQDREAQPYRASRAAPHVRACDRSAAASLVPSPRAPIRPTATSSNSSESPRENGSCPSARLVGPVAAGRVEAASDVAAAAETAPLSRPIPFAPDRVPGRAVGGVAARPRGPSGAVAARVTTANDEPPPDPPDGEYGAVEPPQLGSRKGI